LASVVTVYSPRLKILEALPYSIRIDLALDFSIG